MADAHQELTEMRIWAAIITYAIIVVLIGLTYTGNTRIANLGSWLSGTLTPALLFLSILSFRTAEIARREQADAQRTMAEITERATFVSHQEIFERSLSYLGSCVLQGDRLSKEKHVEMLRERKGGYERLWHVLAEERYGRANEEAKSIILDLSAENRVFFLQEFQESLLEVLRIAHGASLYTQLDRRLKELPSLFTFYKLWRINPQIFLDAKKLTFENFFKVSVYEV